MIKSISPSPLISPESVLHGLWKFFTQSFRECGGQKAGCCGYHPHDEDGGGQPVDLQQVQQEAEDAAYPGHQGAETHCLQRERAGLTPYLLLTWFRITVGNISEVNTYTMEKPALDPVFPIRDRKIFREDFIKSTN